MNDDENVHPNIPEENFLPNVDDTVGVVEQGQDGPTCLTYQGHAFTKKRQNAKDTVFYCKYRRRYKCNCKLRIYAGNLNRFVLEDNPHSDSCKLHQGFAVSSSTGLIDCRVEMGRLAEKYAVENISTLPREIWDRISKEMSSKYTSYTGLSDQQIVNKVKNSRSGLNGGDIALQLEDENFRSCKETGLSFLRKVDY